MDVTLEQGHAPERRLALEDRTRILAEAVASLPEREQMVIALYYQEGLTLKEIGAVLEVTESRVCQIHTQSLLRLRARLERERVALLGTD
jgi:RNA polymerase sigma factor for flagellar operon FliA